jgi:hypothetical protein
MTIKRVLPSKRITKRVVDTLSCPADRDRIFVWDEELSGFGVAAFAGGKKTYFVQYRLHGRTRRFAIGAHGTLTPEEARGKARRDLAAVAKGQDPIDERRREREVPTFQKASDDFMAAFTRQIRAGEKKLSTYKAYRITLDEHILPHLGSRRRCTSRSRTSPSSSTARQSQNCLPAIRTALRPSAWAILPTKATSAT